MYFFIRYWRYFIIKLGNQISGIEENKILKKFNIIIVVNLLILFCHIVCTVLGIISFIPLFIGPMLVVFIAIIIHLVFKNSLKTGDFSIIAGYDKNRDDSVYLRKQLIHIELFTLILSLMCNLLFLLALFIEGTLLVPAALVIIAIDLVGIFMIIAVVNKRIRSRKQYSKKSNQEREVK